MHFEFELQTLKMCLLPIDIIYPTFYDLESVSFDVTLCSVDNSFGKFMLCFSIIVKFWRSTILVQNFNWNYFIYLQFSYLPNIVSFVLICFKFGSHLVESRICKCLSLSLFFTYKLMKFHCVSFFSSLILSFYLYLSSFVTNSFSTCK